MKNLSTLLFLIIPFIALAGGWPKKKGTGYYKLAYSFINGTHIYNSSGSKQPLDRSLGFYTISFYGEYGITDRITTITYIPFVTTARLEQLSGEAGASITTVGDINLGFRYGLIIGQPNVLSLSATFGIPSGRTSTDTSGGKKSLQTGDGEFNQIIQIESGHSLKGNFYASTFFGVNFRSQGFSEEIRFGGEIGHVGDKLISILKFNSISSLGNGDNEQEVNADFFNNNLELLTIAPEFAYKFLDTFGISINHTIYLSGKKTLASSNTTVGIFLEF